MEELGLESYNDRRGEATRPFTKEQTQTIERKKKKIYKKQQTQTIERKEKKRKTKTAKNTMRLMEL